MTIACPCCRATNETATCRRCRADLSLLAAIEARRSFLLDAARVELGQGRSAESLLAEATTLRDGADAAQLRAVGALIRGDYIRALRT